MAIGYLVLKNINNEILVIINNTDKTVKELCLRNERGCLIRHIQEIEKDSKIKINLNKLDYLNFEYRYGENIESILLRNKFEKRKKIKLIIRSVYDDGKLDILVK
ncbi:hypothetical protein QJR26_18840 (plasmid) [Clostridium baratii]